MHSERYSYCTKNRRPGLEQSFRCLFTAEKSIVRKERNVKKVLKSEIEAKENAICNRSKYHGEEEESFAMTGDIIEIEEDSVEKQCYA